MSPRVPAALALLLLCAACASTEPPRVPAPAADFATFSLSENFVFERNPRKPELRVRIALPYIADLGNAEAARRINAEILRTALSVNEDAKDYAAGAEKDFARGVRRFVADEVAAYRTRQAEILAAGEDPLCTENEIIIEGAVRRSEPALLVYEIRILLFFGGAHPSHELRLLNFNPQTGTRITLKDLFKPGFEPALTEMLKRKAAENTDVPANGFFPKPAPHENFALDPDGIAFVFNPYEIAPYSSGTITLKIPYKAVTLNF